MLLLFFLVVAVLLFQLLLLFMLYINDHKFLYLSILPRFKPIQKKLHSSFDTDSPLDRQFASPNSPIQYWLALSYQTTTDGIFGVTDIISRKFFYVMAGNLISLFNAGWPFPIKLQCWFVTKVLLRNG